MDIYLFVAIQRFSRCPRNRALPDKVGLSAVPADSVSRPYRGKKKR